jgi:hypothetical protein
LEIIIVQEYTICPADNATAGSLGRRRAGQLRFGFVAVSAGHIVYLLHQSILFEEIQSYRLLTAGRGWWFFGLEIKLTTFAEELRSKTWQKRRNVERNLRNLVAGREMNI